MLVKPRTWEQCPHMLAGKARGKWQIDPILPIYWGGGVYHPFHGKGKPINKRISAGHPLVCVPSVPWTCPICPVISLVCPADILSLELEFPHKPAQTSQVSLGRPEFFPGTLPGHSDHRIPLCDFLYCFFSIFQSHYTHEIIILELAGLPRFGPVRYGSCMGWFERFRFLVPTVPLWKGFSLFEQEGTVPVPVSVPEKRFQRFRFLFRFLEKRFRRVLVSGSGSVPGPSCTI